MTTFETPEPISVELDLGIGDVHVVASTTRETVVEVTPANPESEADAKAAEYTEVHCASGRLVVKAPKGWRQRRAKGVAESVHVRIEVPIGSRLSGKAGLGTLRTVGRLGAVDFHSGLGDIQLEEAESLRLRSGFGAVAVDVIRGAAEIKTGSGRVELGAVEGSAIIKNSNGDTHVGTIGGDLRVQSANGGIAVDRASSTVVAKTSNGNIHVGIGSRASLGAHTACGQIDVDVVDPVTVWLDLHTHFGRVQNELDHLDRPEPGADTAEIRARTAFGDITVRRLPTTVQG